MTSCMNIASWMVLFEVCHKKQMIFVLMYNILNYQQMVGCFQLILIVNRRSPITSNVSTKKKMGQDYNWRHHSSKFFLCYNLIIFY